MLDIKLDRDEGIIIQGQSCRLCGEDEDYEVEEIILTNKNLILAIITKDSIFGKREYEVVKYPLREIKIIAGKPHVMYLKHDDNHSMQILTYNQRICIEFPWDKKDEPLRWIEAINCHLTGKAPSQETSTSKEKKLSGFNSNSFTNVINSYANAMNNFANKTKKKDETPVDRFNDTRLCNQCGSKNPKNALFCITCGQPLNSTIDNPDNSVRVIPDRESQIRKCPSCGEPIHSFVAVCPSCGFEIKNTETTDTFARFVSQVDICERAIANNPNKGDGWSSWGFFKKTGWVILNILFAFMPVIIYLIKKGLSNTPKLSKDEKHLVSLIENYPIPNDRETILEILTYVKEKIDFLSKGPVDNNSAYILKVWLAKAEQLKIRSDQLFPNDRIVNDSFKEILDDKHSIEKGIKSKATSYRVIAIAIIAYILIGSLITLIQDNRERNTDLVIPETELSNLMPLIDNGKGKVTTNNEFVFSVDYFGISEQEFENYKKICKDAGYTIDCESDGSVFDAFNEDGYNIRVTYWDKKMDVTINDKKDLHKLVWPSSTITKDLPVPSSDYGIIEDSREDFFSAYIGNTDKDGFNEYVDKCIDAGFTIESHRSDKNFWATNSNDIYVYVEYHGGYIIYIRGELSDND